MKGLAERRQGGGGRAAPARMRPRGLCLGVQITGLSCNPNFEVMEALPEPDEGAIINGTHLGI